MSSSSSQASVTRRLTTTGAVALAVATAATLATAPASAAPRPVQDSKGFIVSPARTQISFTYSPTGFVAGTRNQHEARPGLSIVKLYIADYVFTHGTPADKARASEMIRTSNDAIASQLYRKYPQSVSATARTYGRDFTVSANTWGNKHALTNDVRGAFRGTMGAPARPAPGRPLTPAQQAATNWANDMERAALNAPGSSVNERAIRDARRGLDPWIMRLP